MHISVNCYNTNYNIQHPKSKSTNYLLKDTNNPSFKNKVGKHLVNDVIKWASFGWVAYLMDNYVRTKRAKEQQSNDLKNNFEFKDISDEEFSTLVDKAKDSDYGYWFKPLKDKNEKDFSKWGVQLLDYMNQKIQASDKEDPTYQLCQKYVMYRRKGYDDPIDSKESAELVRKMLEKPQIFAPYNVPAYEHILKMNKANLSEEEIKARQEQVKIVLELTDQILLNPELQEKRYSDTICHMLKHTDDKYKKELFQKFLAHPDLFDDKIAKTLYVCLKTYPNEDNEDHELIRGFLNERIDKLIENPELLNDEKYTSTLRIVKIYQESGMNPQQLSLLANDIRREQLSNADERAADSV